MRFLLLIFLSVSNAFAAWNVTLSWNPNYEASLAGYGLYQGNESRVYPIRIACPTNTILVDGVPRCTQVISNLQSGTYYWAVTATNLAGNESPYSTEVGITLPIQNTPPIANPISVATYNGTAITIQLTGSDADGNPISYSVLDLPTKGTLSGTVPNLTYQSQVGAFGWDGFDFRVSDSITNTDARVDILIMSSNLAVIDKTYVITGTNISSEINEVTGGTNYYTNIVSALDTMTLSWSSSEGILQYSLSLFPANWIDYPSQTSPIFVNVRQYPQCFFRLRKPIVVPPPANSYAFGNTNNGASIDTLYDQIPYINTVRYLCVSNVTASKFFARLPADIGTYKLALYSDISGNAGNLLAQSINIINPTNGWNSATLVTNYSLAANTYYWLAVWSDSPSGRIYYSSTTAPLKWQGLAFGTWPATLSASGGGNASYCIYLK